MELTTYIGPEQNLLAETPLHAHRLEVGTSAAFKFAA